MFCFDFLAVVGDNTTGAEIYSRRNSRDICRYAGGNELVVEVFGRIVIYEIGVIRNKPRGALGLVSQLPSSSIHQNKSRCHKNMAKGESTAQATREAFCRRSLIDVSRF